MTTQATDMTRTYKFTQHGQDNQTLEVILHPEQAIHTENGAMAYMETGITMTTGTGRKRGPWALFKRKLSGEELLINIFTNHDIIPQHLGISPRTPNHILPVILHPEEPDIICQKQTFLAGHPDVRVSANIVSPKTTFLGSSTLIMQRLHGHGHVFLTGHGAIIGKDLEEGETWLTEPPALVAFQDTVEYGARLPRGMSNLVWNRDNLFLLSLTGPGKVWFQSSARFLQKQHPRQQKAA